ncbi:MAG: hypothetical protein ACREAD_06995 [Nitrosopumilaceae archaeon]
MGKKEAVVGMSIVIAIGAMLYFTNISDLARPVVEKTINSTEKAASNVTVKGTDVVSEIKTVSANVQNITSQIKIKNPYP